MMPDRTVLIGNVVNYCKGSPKRAAILSAVRKSNNYENVARSVGADPSYSSETLNRLKALGAVESVVGRKGYFQQTQLMRTIDLPSELTKAKRALRSAGPSGIKSRMQSPKPTKRRTPAHVPYFTSDDLSELSRNSDAYATLYAFENSARNFISTVAIQQFGSRWWASMKISSDTQENISKRMSEDQNSRWHQKRKAHPLYYTDFKDLESIIINK